MPHDDLFPPATSRRRSRIVLLGLGHTNAHILKMWRMQPIANTELVCVSNFPVATYSGMFPAVLAGQYAPEDMQIDLVRLTAANGALLILDKVIGLDRDRPALCFESRPPLPFDALSIGIGSVPRRVPGVADSPTVIPIKPMQTFLERLTAAVCAREVPAEGDARRRSDPLRVVVVGGGAGGCELACCLPNLLQRLLPDQTFMLTLIHGGDRLMEGLAPSTSRRVDAILRAREVDVMLGKRVDRVVENTLHFSEGSPMAADVILWATSAVGPPLLETLPLQCDARGFLLTRDTLQTVDDDRIFAVGDSGSQASGTPPKSGVYAVRHGPILWKNLKRLLAGRPLVNFRPQRDFLKLLNLGDGSAMGEWAGVTFQGTWVWRWKDRIDVGFMRKFQDYRPAMAADPKEPPPVMRCTGCGGKVGASVLAAALDALPPLRRPEVVVGLESPDDGAVLNLGGPRSTIVTTDFFQVPLDDLYISGRIAALHALSDAWAMGASPVAALTMATVPYGHPRDQQGCLEQLLAGAHRELTEAQAALVGGHTIEGSAATIGFTILAQQAEGEITRKSRMAVGDQLVLTKPLGSGVLLAAHMRAACRAEWFRGLLEALLSSNRAAAEVAADHGIHAVTDITGFGLAGHLWEMLSASGVSAELSVASLPVLPGVLALTRAGIASTLAPANRHITRVIAGTASDAARFEVLFDPQTNGGLLMAVPEARVPMVLDAMRDRQIAASVVGRAVPAERDVQILLK